MKKSRICALLIAVIICATSLIIPNIFATEQASLSRDELTDSAVTPAESDFQYALIPQNNPQYAVLKKYTGDDVSIIIPEELGGYPVQRVLGSAFIDNYTIQYIRLPLCATTFETGSMEGCTALRYIDVPADNEKFISVDGVLFSKDMTTLVAFPGGYEGSYTVPDSVITIGRNAFSYCSYLTEVIMSNSVEYINDYAFAGCTELSNLRLSDNITVIGNYAMFKCEELSSITIPYSVINIGDHAFLGAFASDNNLVYYVTDGIYYTPGTYAEEYVQGLHLPSENLHHIDRKITDPSTGVTIIDPSEILPKYTKINLKVELLPEEDFASLIGIRYENIFCYNITLSTEDGELTVPDGVVIRFNGLGSDNIPSATKIYRLNNGSLQEIVRAPYTPFAGVYTVETGTYVIATNSDFSLKGDIDGDGILTTYDSQFALCIAAELVGGLTGEQESAANFDSADGITTDDALNILRAAAGII